MLSAGRCARCCAMPWTCCVNREGRFSLRQSVLWKNRVTRTRDGPTVTRPAPRPPPRACVACVWMCGRPLTPPFTADSVHPVYQVMVPAAPEFGTHPPCTQIHHIAAFETKAKCTDGDAITKRSPRMTDMRRHGILNLQDRHCSGLPKHSPLQYSHHFFVVHDMERLMVPPDDFLSNDIDRRIACIAFIGVATGTTFFSGRRISTT